MRFHHASSVISIFISRRLHHCTVPCDPCGTRRVWCSRLAHARRWPNCGRTGTTAEVINCRETETGKIATLTVPPEPMSAVRHVSSRGHGVFNMRANRTGHRCICGCPVTSRALASLENKIGRGRPLDWPERVHMNPFGTCRASAKQECEHTRE